MTLRAEDDGEALHARLRAALRAGSEAGLDDVADGRPVDARDRFLTLLAIYDLHCAPLPEVGEAARWQHHPAMAAVKRRCESQWLGELGSLPSSLGLDDSDPVAALRTLAARDRLPAVYRWIGRRAAWPDVVRFLALEGGPDGGFDDLVASCQTGLFGPAKMELATNYWDEMGNGDPTQVHTVLHDRMAAAIEMPRIPLGEQPVAVLARSALGGLLTTNRWLQPEMLGALGLIELQAGPRSRLVLQGFGRCGAPAAAYPFYAVHAAVDPRHGRDWLDHAIAPTVAAYPEWGPRILRGAHWRSAVNAAFLDEVASELMPDRSEATEAA